MILCWKSGDGLKTSDQSETKKQNKEYSPPSRSCLPVLTRGQADAVSILEFKPRTLEFAFPLLHVGFVFVELENEDVELPLQHVDLSLCQLLLPPLQQLLLGLLLQGSPRQLLFSGAKLLEEADSDTNGG